LFEVTRTDSSAVDFANLADRLTRFLAVHNGENDSFYSKFNKVDGIPTVVVVYANGSAIACGAFRAMGDATVEIKRMFVDPDYRGKGAAKAVLTELETWAAETGATHAVLETSKRLIPAVSLYQASGYEMIENYEPYVGVEDSVCMRKKLG
jgi:GNAT superfamily N-acetyltransferase